MNNKFSSKNHVVRPWKNKDLEVNLVECTIRNGGQSTKVEPLVMDLFELLLGHPNELVSKADILDAIWADRLVNEEALTKLISKLRKLLGDDSKKQQSIKTIPKKGYMLITDQELEVSKQKHWLLIVGFIVLAAFIAWSYYGIDSWSNAGNKPLTELRQTEVMYNRAESHYYQYSRLENESAIKLYEKIIAQDSGHALSQSGLANALVQKTLRWPDTDTGSEVEHVNLSRTIQSGRLDSESVHTQLKRAEGLAKRAVMLAPDKAKVQRALGLVYAVQQRFDLAEQQYKKAIELDENEWGAMINLSEIQSIKGHHALSLATLKQAHQAMSNKYETEEVIIRPWYTKLTVSIAEQSEQMKQMSEAEVWYRQALEHDPYHEPAISGLIRILRQQGDHDAADRLCFDIKQKIDSTANCF